jgi:hypothetical protein
MAAKDFDLARALGAEPAINPAPVAVATTASVTGQPGQKLTGGMANLAAGGNEALASTLGMPVDLATGALNLPARAINAVAGTNLPMITNPVGGQNWWESAMGLIGADPRNVAADGQGDRLIRGIGAGAVGAMLPMAPARAVASGALGAGELAQGVASALGSGSMAGNAAMGATSGYIGQAAEDATTDPRWKPLANMLGQVAGGAGAALTGAGLSGAYRAATGAAGRLAETLPIGAKTSLLDDTGAPVIGTDGQPVMMTQGQAQAATRGVAQAAGMSAPDLAASIPTEAPAVLGDRPTVGQLTGNMRVLGLERKLKTLNREPFNEREASNNTARTAALADLSHPDTQGDAAGQFFVNTLQKIDEAGAAREAAAGRAAQAATSGLGGTASAAELGQAMRGHVEQRFAPVMQTADRAAQEAERRVGATVAAVGGERVGTPAATASEQIGAETRAALDEAHRADDARIARLFDAVDPDKKLALSLQNYRAAAKQMRDEILPGGSGGVSPSEEAVISAAEKAPRVQTFAWVQQERKAINNYAAMARRAGDNNAARRLETVRRGLDADIDAAVADQVRQEAPFVVSGQILEGQSMLGRLAEAANAPQVGSHVFTPSGQRVEVSYRLADASKLTTSHTADMRVNPDFPPELQPRDRTKIHSEQQINSIANDLQPGQLGASASVNEGAPIIGPDGVVESGNGRMLAIRRAYAQNGESAERYRVWLQSQGYNTEGMAEPVLVRQRETPLTPEQRARFTEDAAAPTGLTLSAGEQAAVDARRMSDDTLMLYRGGDSHEAENRDFVRAFATDVTAPGQANNFFTSEGGISLDGQRRVQAALLSNAYQNPDLVSSLIESGDPSIKAFGGALMDAAGPVGRLEAAIRAGDANAANSVSGDLVAAAQMVADARRRRISLGELVAQQDAFAKRNPEAENLLRAAYGDNFDQRLSRARLADILTEYARIAGQQGAGPGMFGDALTREQILSRAIEKYGTNAQRTSAAADAGRSGEKVASGIRNGEIGSEAQRLGDGAAGAAPSGGGGGGKGRRAVGGGVQAETVGDRPQMRVMPDLALEPNLTQSDRDAMRLANSEFAKHQGIFAEGAIADILEKNPRNGGRFEMPDARVVEKLFPGGTMEAKNAHALVAAVGQERASQVAGDALAFNLRSYAARDGAFDSKRLSDWMARHSEALTVFPELRQRFGTLQRAQQTLDGIRDARAQLEKLNPIKLGSTNADVAAQYWRPGPQGTEAVQRFARDAGPQAAQVLHDAAASSLRQSFKNGEFSETTFQSWKKSFGPALAELPADVRAKFDTFASAQRDLAEAAAARKAAVDEYQKGVAQFYLGKDPQKAVESVMGSANPQLNALRLMQATAGDKAAQDGIRKNVADWLIAKTKSTAEAGTTGDKKIAGGVFQRTISNPKIAAALERVFTPDQMEAIRAVGASIARQDRSINATAIAGSPGTAADLHAVGSHGNSSFVDLFLGAGLGEAAAHLSGAGGVVGTAMGAAGVAGAHALRMMRADGLTTVQDIQRAIVLNPELARVMLAKVPVSENVPIMRKLSAALANLATSGVSRNANGDPRP